MYYPKIDTLFNRGADFKVDLSDYRRPEFTYINEWLWMEKLDGANISIAANSRNGGETFWRGRTSKANFTPEIQNHLNLRCEAWHDKLQVILQDFKLDEIEFFGEIYGPKIQSGGIYRDDISTKFYDARVNGNLWLDWKAVLSHAETLGYDVPMWGTTSVRHAVQAVREGFTTYEPNKGGTAEGIVAKTAIPLYTNKGDRLMWKLKTKDFK